VKTQTKFTAEFIKTQMQTSQVWLEHGLLAIYDRQTSDEKECDATVHHNGVGFSPLDAELLGSFARQLRNGLPHLTVKQTMWARKKMVKYAGQLAKIAKANQAAA
jgi:hypothetical protein